MNGKRRVTVFTGTRAEYALLKSVIRGLMLCENCEARTLVSGAHLSEAYGHTVDEIVADGIPVDFTVDILSEDNSAQGVCESTGKGIASFGKIFSQHTPDLLVVLGDRFETFAAAVAAHLMRIPVAHLYGGETTEGAMDEAFRHSITKMSHLHFTSCKEYRERVIQLGEAPERVWDVGSLGVENILSTPLLPEAELRQALGLPFDMPYIVCTMHPATLEAQSPAEQVTGLCTALNNFPEYALVVTGANADSGGSEMNTILEQYVRTRAYGKFSLSLGQKRYFSALKYAACVLGNSSSGIIEAPSFRVPVIDIGARQKGRHRADVVLHCHPDAVSIKQALFTAFSESHRQRTRSSKNPFEQNGTAARIVEQIAHYPLDAILFKPFYNIPVTGTIRGS